MSVATAPTDSVKAAPLSAMAPFISSVPPVAAMVPAPVAVTGADTLPKPVIVPVVSVAPAASVNVAAAASSFTVLLPIAKALVRVNAPAVLTSSVPVEPRNVADSALSAASSSSRSVAPAPIANANEPLLAIAPVISSVPPVAVSTALLDAEADTFDSSLPKPAMPPVDDSVVVPVTVSTVAAPERVSESVPFSVNPAIVVLAVRARDFADDAIITISAAAGIEDTDQFGALAHAVELLPVHVVVAIATGIAVLIGGITKKIYTIEASPNGTARIHRQ